jgi:hypothetical protein
MIPRFGAALVLSASLLILVSGRTAASDPPKKKYVFVEITDRWVAVDRGEWHLVGKLDKNGDFVEEFMWKKGQGKSLTPTITLNSAVFTSNPQKVYEFRSGMLIPGKIERDGQFIPEEGGKIIPFKDYEYSLTATPIWNLPGVFVTEKQAAEFKKAKPDDKK